MAALGVTLLLVVMSFRRKSTPLGYVAALVAAIVLAGVLPLGFVVFPILFGIWRRQPGRGFGWILLTSMVLSALVLYWRIPSPPSMPPGPQRDATAIARQVHVVNQMWGNHRDGGEGLWRTYQMVDLEFTPEGASEPVHVLDRVDLGSVSQLTKGATVRVFYSVSDPRVARIAAGTRTYAVNALAYFLFLTYGLAALIVLVVWPAIGLAERIGRRFLNLAGTVPDGAVQQVSRLPVDAGL